MKRLLLVAPVLAVLLVCVGSVASAFSIDGDLTDWGWNGSYIDPIDGLTFYTDWGSTNNSITAYNSGAEWFDIEGLYVDLEIIWSLLLR